MTIKRMIGSIRSLKKHLLLLLIGLLITGCVTPPPNNIQNICSIFTQYPEWYWEAEKVYQKWGLPPSVLMAIIYQESHFRSNAAPPRQKLLWIIPWKRPTSAYGYSQAINGTWKQYQQDTGKNWGRRSAFDDAADFIGWFAYKTHQKTGVSMNNAYALYLAYHEGIGGYQRKTYANKRWLLDVSQGVQHRANVYHSQLQGCASRLPTKSWWSF